MKGDAAELARRLGERIQSLAPELLPRGYREGRWLRVGSLAGEEGKSLAVTLWGARQGQWRDYASDEHGDALDLVAAVRFDGDLRQAVVWAREWLGLPAQQKPTPKQRAILAPPADRQSRQWAMQIWHAARPVTRGDPVDRYLLARHIDLANFQGPLNALRFHPNLWHRQSGRRWPAMVAAIGDDTTGRPIAVHRTWLEERNLAFEDAPRVGKAPLREPKMTLGGYRGGFIRLWRGSDGVPWHKAEPGEVVVLSEGIEDLLSYAQDNPLYRGACGVSLSAMLHIVLPPEFTQVCLLAQNDPAGSKAAMTLQRVIARLRDDEGRVVFTPPISGRFKDYNDFVAVVPPTSRRTIQGLGETAHERQAG